MPPGNRAALVNLEPVRLAAGLHFHFGAELIDRLARQLAARDRHSLDNLALERLKATVGQQFRHVLDLQVDTQVGLVAAIFFHSLAVRDGA